MNFKEYALTIFKVAKDELKKSEENAKAENKKLDKEWLDKMNTEVSNISDKVFYSGAKTVGDVIKFAKIERKQLLKKLNNCLDIDSEKQMKLTSRLLDLNKLISAQEKAYEEVENKKFDILKSNKQVVISSMLEQLTDKIAKEIEILKNEIVENSSKIAESVGKKDLDQYTKIIKANNKKIIEFSNLKDSLNILKEYNGNIASTKVVNDLTNGLNKEYANLVMGCYNLITSNNINMKYNNGHFGIDNEETEKIKKIRELLDDARNNKDRNKLDEASVLIKELKNADIQNDLQKEAAEVDALIKEKEKYAEVEKLVDEAEKLRTKKSITIAEEEVEKLPECEEKKKLLAKLKATKLLMLDDFKMALEKLNSKIEFTKELSYDEVTNARNLFNELVDVEDITGEKLSSFANDLTEITNIYNCQAQDRLKLEIAEEEPKKVKLSDRIAEFGSSLVKGILGTKLAKRIRKESLRRAIENGNDEKAKKIKNKIKENDIINGVRLFAARNKLASLKPALYKGEILGVNTDGLNNKERRKLAKNQESYFRAINNIDALLNNKLTDLISDEDIINDSERVLVVISQFLKQLSVSDNIEKDYEDFEEFLNRAVVAGSIDNNQFRSYLDEAMSIKYYLQTKTNIDSIYEICLDEVNKETAKYYEKPILYKDGDEVKALPHIKSYNRK